MFPRIEPLAAEYSEEARINSIMRHVDSMKHSLEKEKARAVMEVECEEEKIVNRLSKCREAFLCRLAHANESVWIIASGTVASSHEGEKTVGGEVREITRCAPDYG